MHHMVNGTEFMCCVIRPVVWIYATRTVMVTMQDNQLWFCLKKETTDKYIVQLQTY